MKLTQKRFIAGLLTLAIAVSMIGLPFIVRADSVTDLQADQNNN